VRVNPGRAPTRLGGDGIFPFVDVPHWFTGEVARILRHHRVRFEARAGFLRRADSDDPDDHIDRLSFPSARPEFIQTLIDSVKPPGFA
jgi:hypothetical protein